MQCPRCTAWMRSVDFCGVAVDECLACRSLWVERHGLGILISANDSMLEQANAADEIRVLAGDSAPGDCPVCRTVSLRTGSYRGEELLFCSDCSGVSTTKKQIRVLLRHDRRKQRREIFDALLEIREDSHGAATSHNPFGLFTRWIQRW